MIKLKSLFTVTMATAEVEEKCALPPMPLTNGIDGHGPSDHCATDGHSTKQRQMNGSSQPYTNGVRSATGTPLEGSRRGSLRGLASPCGSPAVRRKVDLDWYKSMHRRGSRPFIDDLPEQEGKKQGMVALLVE